MSNSNRFLKGSVALVIWVSGFILVLGGCGSGFGAASPPLAAWERVMIEQKACEARTAIQVEAYKNDLAKMLAQPIPEHQTDAEVKAMFQKAQDWAQAHKQIREEANSGIPMRCWNEAATKMEAINRAEEWVLRNYPIYFVDPFLLDPWTRGQFEKAGWDTKYPFYTPFPPTPEHCYGQC